MGGIQPHASFQLLHVLLVLLIKETFVLIKLLSLLGQLSLLLLQSTLHLLLATVELYGFMFMWRGMQGEGPVLNHMKSGYKTDHYLMM